MASTQPATTAEGPMCELVGCCCSFVDTAEPSAHTAPTFEVVAPQSVPTYTCFSSFMGRQCRTSSARAIRFFAPGQTLAHSNSRAGAWLKQSRGLARRGIVAEAGRLMASFRNDSGYCN